VLVCHLSESGANFDLDVYLLPHTHTHTTLFQEKLSRIDSKAPNNTKKEKKEKNRKLKHARKRTRYWRKKMEKNGKKWTNHKDIWNEREHERNCGEMKLYVRNESEWKNC